MVDLPGQEQGTLSQAGPWLLDRLEQLAVQHQGYEAITLLCELNQDQGRLHEHMLRCPSAGSVNCWNLNCKGRLRSSKWPAGAVVHSVHCSSCKSWHGFGSGSPLMDVIGMHGPVSRPARCLTFDQSLYMSGRSLLLCTIIILPLHRQLMHASACMPYTGLWPH